MTRCFFISDLHGQFTRYDKLFSEIRKDKPEIVFNAGDILPHGLRNEQNFVTDYLIPVHEKLKIELKKNYPQFYYIFGNDDPAVMEEVIEKGEPLGLWQYIHNKICTFKNYFIAGYNFVPPTPFLLKDWEKYDISRFTDPGCISPEEGIYTTDVNKHEKKYSTIAEDLGKLNINEEYSKLILIAHSPPYETALDMLKSSGKFIDNIETDPHAGSIAIKRFIENKQPYLTLHGHIHESSTISGKWMDKTGRTISLNAATDNPGKLSIIKFDLEDLYTAERILI